MIMIMAELDIAKKLFNNSFVELLMNKFPSYKNILQEQMMPDPSEDDAEEYCVQDDIKCVTFSAKYNVAHVDSRLLALAGDDNDPHYVINAEWADIVDYGLHECKKYFKIFWENWIAEYWHLNILDAHDSVNGEFGHVTSAFHIGDDKKNVIYICMKAFIK